MPEELPNASIEARLRTLQMIVAVLIAGVVIFAAIVAFARIPPAAALNPNVSTSLMLAVITILLAAVLVRVRRSDILHAASDEVGEKQVFARFAAWTIATAGMCEGAALLSVVLAMLSGDLRHLIFAGAAVLLVLIAMFPTRTRWDAFVSATSRRQ